MYKQWIPQCLFMALFMISSVSMGQTLVSSLEELLPYLDKDEVHVKLKPGSYSITAREVEEGKYTSETVIAGRDCKVLLLFEGNNSTYDFTDVTLNVETAVFKSFGNHKVYEIQIIGNHNILKNLRLVDDGSVHDAPTKGACNIVMDGRSNRVEGFHITVKGSFPYGYGDAFGKGGGPVIAHQKHSALLIRGESNHVKNCTLIHRSYGHCIFMQAASNPLVEGCYVEGEMRSTDDMLAEEGSGSPADKVGFMTAWGYKLPPGYMLSLGEAGVRAYNAGETVIDGLEYERGTSNPTVLNCTIKYMRTGVTLAHATGAKYVEGCTAIGCENGYSLGSGQVVNCSADATYGPVYQSTYNNDKQFDADITILPAIDEYYNGMHSVAYIAGSNHTITLRNSEAQVNPDLKIQMGGDKGNIRLFHGNNASQNHHEARNITLNNLTGYPVYLPASSKEVSGQSCGEIHDQGQDNTLQRISCE